MRTLIVFLTLALAVPSAFAQEAPGARIEKLVKQLGSDEYQEREDASRKLKEIGRPAIPALKKALKSEDLEVRLRAESILKEIGGQEKRPEPGRPYTPDPSRPRRTVPRFGKGLEELLKDLPEEQRKQVEEMLKRMEELEKNFDPPKRRPPAPGRKEDLLPDAVRKMLEDMDKQAEELKKRFEEARRRARRPAPEKKPEAPRTEPRGEKEDARKQPQPPGRAKAGATIVIKRLRWKDGRLVEEEEYNHDSKLPGLFVIDSGEVLRALRYHLELGEKEGVLVDSVEKDGPFAKAGLQKHDIITKVDGKTVDSRETLARLLKDKDKAALEVLRRGSRTSLEVEFGSEKKTPEKDK